MEKYEVVARRGPRWAYDVIDIYVRRIEFGNIRELRKIFYPQVVYTEVDESDDLAYLAQEPEPMLKLPVDAAQMLFDDLWNLGLRPSQSQIDSKGALAEAKEHIASLKEVVRPLLNTVVATATLNVKGSGFSARLGD